MARRVGGYKKADRTEWAECDRRLYGEAIVSAASMDQDEFVWMNDAIAHHVYRCEQVKAQERYQMDMAAFNAGHTDISPQKHDPRYQVTRARPEITVQQPGQSTAPGPKIKP